MPPRDYARAVDYLQRYLWQQLPILPVERALQARILTLLDHFGRPHERFPVAHVGGSAGKGSTAAIVASILQAAGLRTGLYTSPHLQTFVERISVDGTLMPAEAFAREVLALDPIVRRMHVEVLDGVGRGRPSLVEVAFAVGMHHFAQEACEAAVVEVGLGGRTDCTNVFAAPAVTMVTNVEFEHRERLGPDIASIAREKAAIIKGGIAVTGARRNEAVRIIEDRAAETGATLWRLGREIRLRSHAQPPGEGSEVRITTPLGAVSGHLALDGAHQARNAALAVAAAQAFGHRTGAPVTDAAVVDGLASVRISGRLEVVQRAPVVLLDGAHNPAEARALADELLRWRSPRRRIVVVCGILGDKEQAPMVRALAAVADQVVVTKPPLEERAGDPARVVALFQAQLGARRVTFERDPWRALDAALTMARERDVVCVTGSLFLVGLLRGRWIPEGRILRRRSAALDWRPARSLAR